MSPRSNATQLLEEAFSAPPPEEPPAEADFLDWGEVDRASAAGSRVEASKEPIVIKFLQPGPYDQYSLHWITTAEGKRPYRCRTKNVRPADQGPCPLCDGGCELGAPKTCFNVIAFDDPTAPRVALLEVGNRVLGAIRAAGKDKRYGPLTRTNLYFAYHKTGEGMKTEYHLARIPLSELADPWGVSALSEEQIAEYATGCRSGHVKPIPSIEEMEAVAIPEAA